VTIKCTIFQAVIPSNLVEASLFLVACLAYFSTLKMEAVVSFETSVKFYGSIRCYTSEGILLNNSSNLLISYYKRNIMFFIYFS
jgi:hypothetical protein